MKGVPLVLSLLCLFLSPVMTIRAQYVPTAERGNPNARRRSVIDTNLIRTSLQNFGYGGRTDAAHGMPYEWSKGTNRYYLALATMFVGGEVIDVNGDTIHIVSVPAFRTNLLTGQSWNFEPVPEYQNPNSNQLARSDDPATWPPMWIDQLGDSTDPGWPGAWNGLFGKNLFINGTETYHHFADNLYSRYRYYPIPSDTTRRGLGIVVSQRTLAWREPFLEDAIVTVSDIYNVGIQNIERAAVTMWIADFLGGDGDSQDDLISYNLLRKTLYFKDRDGLSSNQAFANARVLMPALVFLQTPTNSGVELGMTNIQYLPTAINFSQTADIFFWNTLMRPGSFVNPQIIPIGDDDAFASCGYFPLPAHGSQRFVTAFVFAEDSLNINRKVNYLKGLVGGSYSPNGVQVSITLPQPGQVLSGQSPIHWDAGAGRQSLKIDMFYSSNAGDTWRLLAQGVANGGSSVLNTDTLSDGIFYRLMLVAYDSLGLGYRIMDSTFTINNPQQAPPQIRLNKSIAGRAWQSQIPVRWVAGDADGDSVAIDFSYRTQGSPQWIPIVAGLPNTGQYALEISGLPNSSFCIFRGIARAGTLSGTDTAGILEIRNPRYVLPETAFVQRNTRGTGIIQPSIVNPAQVNGHTYNVVFSGPSDSATSYSVIDQNSGLTVVSGATQIDGTVEGPMFDGIRMFVRTDGIFLNQSETRWNHQGIHRTAFELFTNVFDFGYREPRDYLVEIGNVGLDTSNAAIIAGFSIPSRSVNFTVKDATTGQRVPFAFVESDGDDGRLTTGNLSDVVILLRRFSPDSIGPTWSLYMLPDSLGNPLAGDTLIVRLHKPFQNLDSYRFTAITGPLLGVPDERPNQYALSQNYPNPFNPQTDIRFSIGSVGHTVLEIYDVLGRRVRTLVNERLDPGEHILQWNGQNDNGVNVSSGVYFYRVISGTFMQTRKMLLLR